MSVAAKNRYPSTLPCLHARVHPRLPRLPPSPASPSQPSSLIRTAMVRAMHSRKQLGTIPYSRLGYLTAQQVRSLPSWSLPSPPLPPPPSPPSPHSRLAPRKLFPCTQKHSLGIGLSAVPVARSSSGRNSRLVARPLPQTSPPSAENLHLVHHYHRSARSQSNDRYLTMRFALAVPALASSAPSPCLPPAHSCTTGTRPEL